LSISLFLFPCLSVSLWLCLFYLSPFLFLSVSLSLSLSLRLSVSFPFTCTEILGSSALTLLSVAIAWQMYLKLTELTFEEIETDEEDEGDAVGSAEMAGEASVSILRALIPLSRAPGRGTEAAVSRRERTTCQPSSVLKGKREKRSVRARKNRKRRRWERKGRGKGKEGEKRRKEKDKERSEVKWREERSREKEKRKEREEGKRRRESSASLTLS
jgi:hypothetical protein